MMNYKFMILAKILCLLSLRKKKSVYAFLIFQERVIMISKKEKNHFRLILRKRSLKKMSQNFTNKLLYSDIYNFNSNCLSK